jgi:hypothetical protein
MLLDARFRGHDGEETAAFFCELLGQDTKLNCGSPMHWSANQSEQRNQSAYLATK